MSQDSTDDNPQSIADERRFHNKALSIWKDVRQGLTFPKLSDFNPADLARFKDNTLILDVRSLSNGPTISLISPAIIQHFYPEDEEKDFVGHSIDELEDDTVIGRMTKHYHAVLRDKKPITIETFFMNRYGVRYLFRGIFLPISDAGRDIELLWCVVNWKEDVPGSIADLNKLHDKIMGRRLDEANNDDDVPADSIEVHDTPVAKEPAPPLEQETAAETPQADDGDHTAEEILAEIEVEGILDELEEEAHEEEPLSDDDFDITIIEQQDDDLPSGTLTEDNLEEEDDDDVMSALLSGNYHPTQITPNTEFSPEATHDMDDVDVDVDVDADIAIELATEPVVDAGEDPTDEKEAAETNSDLDFDDIDEDDTEAKMDADDGMNDGGMNDEARTSMETGAETEPDSPAEEDSLSETALEEASSLTVNTEPMTAADTLEPETASEYQSDDATKSAVDHAGLDDFLAVLAETRKAASRVAQVNSKSRHGLYRVLEGAYHLYQASRSHQDDYQKLLQKYDLREQERAPFTPIMKLIFGKTYDKTRLTEYAAAVSWAWRQGVESHEVAHFIAHHPGGIKGCVKDERREKRRQKGQIIDEIEPIKAALKQQEALLVTDLGAPDSEEFVVLLGRRNDAGKIEIVKVLNEAKPTLDDLIKRSKKATV